MIYGDLVEGDSVTITPIGASVQRKEILTGITGNSYQKIYNAIYTSGHYIGEQHPIYSDSYIQSIGGVALSTDTIALTLSYEPMTNLPVEIQISNRVASMETNIDFEETPIEVTYTYPSDYVHNEALRDITDVCGKTVEKQIPTTTISIKRREIISGKDLITLQKTYTGYVNSNTMWGDGEKNWLLTGIDSTFAGYVWQEAEVKWVCDVQYTWEKPVGGWDAWVCYIDPNTGDPPDPTTWITGTNKQIQIYSTIDFSPLLVGL